MTKQSTIVCADLLQQAIQTVIQDIRIPKNLRTTLALYQNQRADLTSHGISVVRPESTNLSTAFRLGGAYQSDDAGSCEGDSILNGVCGGLVQRLDIQMEINVESLDWSLEINGYRHEHITTEIMEALIEAVVIFTVSSVTKTFSARPQ